MDSIIKEYPFKSFGDDLNYCYEHGIMYQKDMSSPVAYDKEYFNNYVKRENTEIARKLNKARCGISKKHCKCIVDVGVGSGEFIKTLQQLTEVNAYGYDINPIGVNWLKDRNLYVDIYDDVPEAVEGFTLWDTLEHIPNPQEFFRVVSAGQFLLISLPIFDEIEMVKQSKHYKNNEHLYYYTHDGLIVFMHDSGFDFIEANNDETEAGREGIETFVFSKR